MNRTPIIATLAIAATVGTSAAVHAELTRVATVPLGAEVTGMFSVGPDLFFNVQHPDTDLPTVFSKATVGVIANIDLDAPALPVPDAALRHEVTSSLGTYQVLVQEGDFDTIGKLSGAGGVLRTSNDPDFNAYVPTGDNTGYLFTNWEDRPGGMSRVRIQRDANGAWQADGTDAAMLDFSSVKGTWVNCFGTLSPWGTPLSSEELYFDDTAEWNNPGYDDIAAVADLESYLGTYPNPYDYGYIVEITDPAGRAQPVKRHALGRFSHENAVVMPDRKTVYLSDDGTDVVFFKFVADRAGDLTSGTLFAAKVMQDAEPGTPAASAAFGIAWIELAHGSESDIARWIAEYDGIDQGDFQASATSYISDEEVSAWARGEAADDRVAFLESRKAARAKGATAEFRKMEGVNINAAGAANGTVPYAYMAMSEVSKGMADDKGDIQVAESTCGVVYRMRLDSRFNIHRMEPVVAGGRYDKDAAPNACDVDGIANPDNILVLDNGDVLIGEDTSHHENNAIWWWNASAVSNPAM